MSNSINPNMLNQQKMVQQASKKGGAQSAMMNANSASQDTKKQQEKIATPKEMSETKSSQAPSEQAFGFTFENGMKGKAVSGEEGSRWTELSLPTGHQFSFDGNKVEGKDGRSKLKGCEWDAESGVLSGVDSKNNTVRVAVEQGEFQMVSPDGSVSQTFTREGHQIVDYQVREKNHDTGQIDVVGAYSFEISNEGTLYTSGPQAPGFEVTAKGVKFDMNGLPTQRGLPVELPSAPVLSRPEASAGAGETQAPTPEQGAQQAVNQEAFEPVHKELPSGLVISQPSPTEVSFKVSSGHEFSEKDGKLMAKDPQGKPMVNVQTLPEGPYGQVVFGQDDKGNTIAVHPQANLMEGSNASDTVRQLVDENGNTEIAFRTSSKQDAPLYVVEVIDGKVSEPIDNEFDLPKGFAVGSDKIHFQDELGKKTLNLPLPLTKKPEGEYAYVAPTQASTESPANEKSSVNEPLISFDSYTPDWMKAGAGAGAGAATGAFAGAEQAQGGNDGVGATSGAGQAQGANAGAGMGATGASQQAESGPVGGAEQANDGAFNTSTQNTLTGLQRMRWGHGGEIISLPTGLAIEKNDQGELSARNAEGQTFKVESRDVKALDGAPMKAYKVVDNEGRTFEAYSDSNDYSVTSKDGKVIQNFYDDGRVEISGTDQGKSFFHMMDLKTGQQYGRSGATLNHNDPENLQLFGASGSRKIKLPVGMDKVMENNQSMDMGIPPFVKPQQPSLWQRVKAVFTGGEPQATHAPGGGFGGGAATAGMPPFGGPTMGQGYSMPYPEMGPMYQPGSFRPCPGMGCPPQMGGYPGGYYGCGGTDETTRMMREMMRSTERQNKIMTGVMVAQSVIGSISTLMMPFTMGGFWCSPFSFF